jgi:hypothetical protein
VRQGLPPLLAERDEVFMTSAAERSGSGEAPLSRFPTGRGIRQCRRSTCGGRRGCWRGSPRRRIQWRDRTESRSGAGYGGPGGRRRGTPAMSIWTQVPSPRAVSPSINVCRYMPTPRLSTW